MENKFKLRAVIYARVSTIEQAKGGKMSIPNQISECKKVIKDNNWELVHEPYIDEGVSGHLLEERRGLQELLRDARNHSFDLVVVKDFDRFARNKDAATAARKELKELYIQTFAITTPVSPRNPQLYDPEDDDLGIMVEGVSDTMSEIERNKIRRRMREGKNAVAKKGKIPNNVPYGYKIIRWYDEAEKKLKRRVEVDEEEAKWVKWIFNEYINGKGMLQIAFELNQKRIKAPRGELWRRQAIKYILQNKTYVGKVLWGWRHADFKKNQLRKLRNHQGIEEDSREHKAIIPPEIFELAQREKKIRGNSQKGRAQLSRGLLTGIAKCIRCKSGVNYLTRHHHRKHKNPKWNDTTTHEYLCSGYKYSGICQRRVMSADKLEDFVIGQIKNMVNNPSVREKLILDNNVSMSNNIKGDYDYAVRMLAEIPKKRQRVQEAYEAGLTPMEVYGEALKRLAEEENQYSVVAGDYEIQLQKLKVRQMDLEKFTKSLEDFDTLWDSAEFEEKKHFLRMILKEVRAGNGKIEIDFRF